MVTFSKDKMLILVHKKMNVLYVRLVSSKYIYRLKSYGKSPITSGSPLVKIRKLDPFQYFSLFYSLSLSLTLSLSLSLSRSLSSTHQRTLKSHQAAGHEGIVKYKTDLHGLISIKSD